MQNAENWSFHVVDLQKRAAKCTKVLNERADPFFFLLSLLSGDLLDRCCCHRVFSKVHINEDNYDDDLQ